MIKNKIWGRVWSAFLIIVMLVFIISVAFAFPIWFRPFYYMQIKPLNIEAESGFTRDQIVGAFNEVMNYLNFGTPFGTGELLYSESGKSHFEDCKVLFDLDTWALIISSAILLIALVLAKLKILVPEKLGGFNFWFYASVLGIAIPLIAGVAIAVDFDNAFVIFHKLFFPGKENWLFSWYDDQIIRILPSQFFLNCGIAVITILLGLCIAGICTNIVSYKKAKKALKQ